MRQEDPLLIFYAEPETDRWLPLDRYLRRLVRRLARGRPQPGGMARYFLNLQAGLDRLAFPYRVNDYAHARRHPRHVIGVVGKAHVLRETAWDNPIVFGPAVPSHPVSDLDLIRNRPVRRILVSCHWMKAMYDTVWPGMASVWAAGIDTDRWSPTAVSSKAVDVLLYDKIRWNRDQYDTELLNPVLKRLKTAGLVVEVLRYGTYREEEYQAALDRARCMIFLCEHETQGFAYLQALSSGVPIMAWDRGGYWQDPAFFPHAVQFAPVSSVPYWDERCGVKFQDAEEFATRFEEFWECCQALHYSPRSYVTENLALEKCAEKYVHILRSVES